MFKAFYFGTGGDGRAYRWTAHKRKSTATKEFLFRRNEFMLGIILGIFVVLLGAKAFTPQGLPLTREKNLTGATAKIIGVICVLFGLALIADGVLASFSIISLLGGGGQ